MGETTHLLTYSPTHLLTYSQRAMSPTAIRWIVTGALLGALGIVLGAYGASDAEHNLTGYLIDDWFAVDAGTLTSKLSFAQQARVQAVDVLVDEDQVVRARLAGDLHARGLRGGDRLDGQRRGEVLEVDAAGLVAGLVDNQLAKRDSEGEQPLFEIRVLIQYHFIERLHLLSCQWWRPADQPCGQIQRCGWLQDKFGLSWQIIPRILGDLLQDPDPEKSQKAMQAMLQMDKIDIDGLRASVGA